MPRIQFPPLKIVQSIRAVFSQGAAGNHLKPCDRFDNSCSKINVLTMLASLLVLSVFSYICSSTVVLQDIYSLGTLYFKQYKDVILFSPIPKFHSIPNEFIGISHNFKQHKQNKREQNCRSEE